jgi:hypothetical protein
MLYLIIKQLNPGDAEGGTAMAKAQLHSKIPTEDKNKLVNKSPQKSQDKAKSQPAQILNGTPSSVHVLQRTIGNRAVQRLVANTKPRSGDSSVIQRHVGSMAEPAGSMTDSFLADGFQNVGQGFSAIAAAQSMFQTYRSLAASEPVPQPGGNRGGEGHGYEFDDDVQESDISLPNEAQTHQY